MLKLVSSIRQTVAMSSDTRRSVARMVSPGVTVTGWPSMVMGKGVMARGRSPKSKAPNPNSEARNPKEIRGPKSEIRIGGWR